MNKYRNYCVFVEASYAERESNRVDFFPATCRIPLSTDATRLTAALENLRHELTPQPTNLLTGTHGTPLNIAVRRLRNLISPVLSTASDTLSTSLPTSPPKETSTSDNAELQRVIGTAPPRVYGKAAPRVAEIRGRYNIGTPIIKKFNGIPYNGNVVSDNGRWYKIKYEDDDEEELTHREMTTYVQQANKVTLANGWRNAYFGLVQQEQDKAQREFDEMKDFENTAYSITDPESGKQLEYRHLWKNPKTKQTWNISGTNEFGRLM